MEFGAVDAEGGPGWSAANGGGFRGGGAFRLSAVDVCA